MKKTISFIILLFFTLTPCIKIFSADNVKDGWFTALPNEPAENSERLALPSETGRFKYDFTEKQYQFSDFIIRFFDTDTDIIIYHRAQKNQKLKLDLMKISYDDKNSKRVVYSKTFTSTLNWEKFVIDADSLSAYIYPNDKKNIADALRVGGSYYIQLTDPSGKSSGAEGEIIVTGSYGNGKEITYSRGDFCIAVADLLSNGSYTEDEYEEQFYDDLSPYNYPNKAVSYLHGLGIVKGYGYKTFNHKGKITYAQAFNIAARLFASEEEISVKAPYPIGGVSLCSELGLTSGIHAVLSDHLTAAHCKMLLDNIEKNRDKIRFN